MSCHASPTVIKGGAGWQNRELNISYTTRCRSTQTTVTMSGEIDAVYVYDEHK